jgi:signal transduction histidine kinase
VLLQVVWLLFLEFPDGKANALLVWPSAATAEAIDRVQRGALVASAVVLAIVLVARWLRASPARRRAIAPALAGGATVLLLALQVVIDLAADEPSRITERVVIVALVSIPAVFLVGLLRARLAVVDLLRELQGRRSPRELEQAMARALGDPSLGLAIWTLAVDAFVSQTGDAVDPGAGDGERVATAIPSAGGQRALLLHDRALADEPVLIDAAVSAAAIVLEQQQLEARLDESVLALRTSQTRIVAAGDSERRRLERNLHDGAQQRFVALALALGGAERRIRDDPETARRLLIQARGDLREGLEELRELARGIHPAVLSDHGLAVALEGLATRAPVPVALDVDLSVRLPEPVEIAAYFVVSEAIANVAKYAHASGVAIRVRRDHGRALIEVRDDGIGGADEGRGSGLRGLADRVEALSGRLEVRSPAGGGTRITARIPCAWCSPRMRCCSGKDSRACSRSPALTSWRGARRPRSCCRRSAATSRTSPWSTSGCRPATRTKGCVRRASCVPGTRASASWCSRSTASPESP